MPTILIVDDEPVILDVLSRFLRTGDRTLLHAGSSAEALEQAKRAEDVDVALVDKNLGDGSGLDLARALKQARPDVEVILVTGYASFDSAIEAVRIGAFDYVTKPVSDYDALNLKVENAIEKVRMKREQRALFARLADSEERYRGVFQASSDAILLFDEASGRIEDANPAALALYGHAPEALRQMRSGDLFAPGGPAFDAGDRSARTVPARHVKADGTAFAVEFTVSDAPLAGDPLRVCSVRDVSERERAEAARRELEDNLRHAQKMEAIGRLAGGVAHDFSNILAVVLGYSELLMRDLPAGDARLRESVSGILEAANRAVGVTRQLLTVSRKKLVKPEVLSLNEVVGGLQKLLSRAVGERIELETSLAPDLWPVEADADQLAQVLLNLAVNARDAMSSGGRITVRTANVSAEAAPPGRGLAPGRYVSLSVKDEGCGMTEEVRSRIFEPFFTTKESGTGLGLATVYGIVRQAGGDVQVESAPGRGSTFSVYLPVASPNAARAVHPAEAQPRRARRGETILVVEDEGALRNLLQRVLSMNGYRVLQGCDGAEALAAARRHRGPIHLLLTDVVMPRMSGMEVAEALAAERPATKVLYMTGHSDDAGIHERLLSSGVDLIQKPFTSEALLAEVRRLLDASPVRATG